jgi:pyruvate/2-oxoglutarate dehydrogenase complex dihydrolipoamide dehydrogenase (E3) component
MSSYLSSRLDAETGTTRVVERRALFIMVGASPNTEWLSGLVDLDAKGFVITGPGAGVPASSFATSRPGIFAVGDVRAGSVKRVASSVGEGSVVISKVWEFNREAVSSKKHLVSFSNFRVDADCRAPRMSSLRMPLTREYRSTS